MSCTHKATAPSSRLGGAISSPETSAANNTALGIQLTQSGNNASPFLSADERKILFISHSRPSHQQAQVYVLDLENLKERRVTYQDGECRDPIFIHDGQLVYASTTDEVKERPRLLQKNSDTSPYPPTELYRSELSGVTITRLTHEMGFDGMAWPRPDRAESILYSHWNGKNLEVRQLNLRSLQTIPVLAKKDRSIEFLRPSPDGKEWAWIEAVADSSSEIWLSPPGFAAAKQKPLALPKGPIKDLIWLSNQKLLFAAKFFKKNFQLYSLDLSNQCLQNVFDSKTDLGSPQLQKERQALIFTSSTNDVSQIFYKSLPVLEAACMKWDNGPPPNRPTP